MLSRVAIASLALGAFAAPASADMSKRVAAVAPSALVVVMDEAGNTIVEQNAGDAFVPASVAKVVTAWLAMDVLGPDYRFETPFYVDADRVLYVAGAGDPFLVSEELALLAPELLEAAGENAFSRLVVDASYYPNDLRIPGIEASGESYDALNAALAVNFNTLNARRRGQTVTSAEEQTPITPLAIDEFRARGPNGRGRISFADSQTSVRYAGELIAAFIGDAGGSVTGEVSIGPVPDGLTPVYVHRQSRDLRELVRLMLAGSNNFIANQIFLEIGAQRLGGPASLDKSLQVAREVLAREGLAEDIRLEEGSGISRGNRFTARGLIEVLDRFAPYANLMTRSEAGSRYKTGTFSGVSTLAGYARTQDYGNPRFVISSRGGGNLRFRILRAIETAPRMPTPRPRPS